MSEYLWDRSGEPDPEVERLERLLSPLRLESTGAPIVRRRSIPWGAIAACVLLGAFSWRLFPHLEARRTDWTIADGGRPIYAGERVHAGTGAKLAIESDATGRIELAPGSEMRVMESVPGRQRMKLEQGHLHALIWAPPAQFVVETPSARAIDLGCQYDLSVDVRGDGLLRVETGWVAFQTGSNESFIPAGAACRTTKARGPGIPYFEDATTAFRASLDRYERTGAADELAALLANARREDGLTLWHLLSRVSTEQRGVVFDRFAQVVTLPAGIREKAIAGDSATIDACWNALGLADAAFWRDWKRAWR